MEVESGEISLEELFEINVGRFSFGSSLVCGFNSDTESAGLLGSIKATELFKIKSLFYCEDDTKNLSMTVLKAEPIAKTGFVFLRRCGLGKTFIMTYDKSVGGYYVRGDVFKLKNVKRKANFWIINTLG